MPVTPVVAIVLLCVVTMLGALRGQQDKLAEGRTPCLMAIY
jgi:hypothetical protein